MVSTGPSTASMVPRMRTVGACCAHATVPNTAMAVNIAAPARGIDQEKIDMMALREKLRSPVSANTAQLRIFLRRPGQANIVSATRDPQPQACVVAEAATGDLDNYSSLWLWVLAFVRTTVESAARDSLCARAARAPE